MFKSVVQYIIRLFYIAVVYKGGFVLELFQLRYFLIVAKYENFSKAADELFISQPSVSKAIHTLETELGVSLFDRFGKRIKLNNAGKALQERLKGVMATLDNLPNELRVASGASQTTIVLNVLAATSLLSDMLSKFKKEYPLINFELIQKDRTAKCDLCISSSLPNILLENGTLVLSEELKLAVPMTSKTALSSSVNLADLQNESFIILNKNHMLRDITLHFFKLCGYTPNVAFESDSPQMIRELVSAGLGTTVWPEFTWGKINSDKAKLLDIKNPICRRNIFITWPENNIAKQEIQIFLEFAKNYFKQLIQR
ncbi:MAG: LysR family transcriptional regulator [Synergistes jonesii]|uniref:LysR family transcriptional regulator n=1 Tax=Synergistes jonesii TaxID=2754 RepID=UPI002A7496EC|nr:LysR family transcriptional regulator [Synergistes jonesii]MDY2984061.1 LysR family transcriptional regulator [Synergistes jonesii]